MASLYSIDLSPPLFPSLSFSRKSFLSSLPLKTHNLSTKPTLLRCTSNKNTSLSSNVDQLQEEEEEEEFNRTNDQDPGERLAKKWREIHGQDDWAGLLDPMDPLLRSELIRYGEFAQACYDAFDYDLFSRYCGSCKYNRQHFFERLGMASFGYEVTRYLYATSNFKIPKFFTQSISDEQVWSERANWIGYIAVSNDALTAQLGRRDIVVAWRGTVTRLEWIADFKDYLRPVTEEGIPCPDPWVKVESGFIDLYTDKDPTCQFCKYSAREQVLTKVRKLVEIYSDERGEEVSVTMTGHSLGSALAKLSAYDLAETGAIMAPKGKKAWVTVFSFSGPCVGNGRFKERFEQVLGLKALRVVNVHDPVPKVPGMFVNEHRYEIVRKWGDGLPWSYHHVGVELALNHKRSPFLKETSDQSCFHNLEAHLHLLDGYHGRGERFILATGRDPALVNKASDFLKAHHLVPPFWRQDQNKGMTRSPDRRWMQPEREKLDDHPHDTHHYLDRLGLVENHKS
ncbi:phospholipase A1-Igamma1 [Carex littledalei]|uniref:Phospholipase A1-Igamma1 n=1 Tax=Carex littledalei TaxID=544730 RepID=A0A833R3C4_9POAL|nr:phospholipase A1-Igamma1 [Carex littledalei]